jgi:hypothetical protein
MASDYFHKPIVKIQVKVVASIFLVGVHNFMGA